MRRRFCHSSRNGQARLALVLLGAAGSLLASSATVAQDKLAAVLKTHETEFIYRSSVNFFACDELRRHVATILRAVGARDDVQVRVSECEFVYFPNDPSPTWDRSTRANPADRFRDPRADERQFSTVRVKLMFPIEATPEVMAEIDKDKSRRELVSRVTGNPAAALDDAIVFPAERREVTLSQKSIRLRPEHCELLEQMIPTVFRKLDVKVIRRQLSCDPHERSNFAPKLVVQVLWPVGTPVPGEK